MRGGSNGIEHRRYPQPQQPNYAHTQQLPAQNAPVSMDAIRSSLFATSNGSARSGAIGAAGSRPGIQMSGSSYARPASGGSNDRLYAEQSERMMESQNDALTARLAEKVGILKQISLDIGVEVKEQNRMLENVDHDMAHSQSMMGKTLQSLQHMVNTGGSKHMCYLVLFIFAIFLLVYWLVR